MLVVAQVEALDLNPGVAKIDRKTRKEFEEFKTKRKEGCVPHPLLELTFLHTKLGAMCTDALEGSAWTCLSMS